MQLAEDMVTKYAQPYLLAFILEGIFSPESPFEISDDASGIIMMHLMVFMDCLHHADSDPT